MHVSEHATIERLDTLDNAAQRWVLDIAFKSTSILIPFRSPDVLEGILVLGERSGDLPITKDDMAFIKTITTHVTALLFHITPLNIIKQATAQLEEGDDLTAFKQCIDEEVDRADNIVKETLKITDTDISTDRVEQPVDINHAIDNCLKLSPVRDVQLTVELEPDLPAQNACRICLSCRCASLSFSSSDEVLEKYRARFCSTSVWVSLSSKSRLSTSCNSSALYGFVMKSEAMPLYESAATRLF